MSPNDHFFAYYAKHQTVYWFRELATKPSTGLEIKDVNKKQNQEESFDFAFLASNRDKISDFKVRQVFKVFADGCLVDDFLLLIIWW